MVAIFQISGGSKIIAHNYEIFSLHYPKGDNTARFHSSLATS